MQTSRRLIAYFQIYWKRIAGGILLTTLMGLSDALWGPFLRILIDALGQISTNLADGSGVIARLNFGHEKVFLKTIEINGYNDAVRMIGYFGIAIVALVLFKGACVYGKEYIMASVSQKVLLAIRKVLFHHLMHLKMVYFDREQTGSMMSRVTNDVANIEQSFIAGISVLQSAIYSIIFVIMMLITNWKLTLVTLLLFPFFGLIIKYFAEKFRVISRKIADQLGEMTAYLSESLSAIKLIKSFRRENYEIDRFNEKNSKHYSYNMKSSRLVALQKPVNEILSMTGLILMIMYGGYQIINQEMTFGMLSQFLFYLTMAYKPMKGVGSTTSVIQRALASADRIFEVLDVAPEQESRSKHDRALEVKHGKVEFENVWFSYDNRDKVLRGISFVARPGETIALVGPSGVGKSTIINLLLRLYEINKGKIIIDDQDIANAPIASVRRHFSLVPQETILFSGSIYDNIRYGNLDATQSMISDAAKAANAHDFIMALPQQYLTEVGEKGVQLSGGQRQRIAIARAILSDAKILLLDEATSALDSESERLVKEATERLMKERTSFVIAHRLSTIQSADKILVIHQGKIAESGLHEPLLAMNGLYKKYYSEQFSR